MRNLYLKKLRKSTIGATEYHIKIENEEMKFIRINKKGYKMSTISKIIGFLLPLMPIETIANYFLDLFRTLVKKTETIWDDSALLLLWSVLYTLKLSDKPPQSLIDRVKAAINPKFINEVE